MIAFSIAFAANSNRLGLISEEIFKSLRASVDLEIGLIGGMMLWCGILKVAEKSGLVDSLAHIIRPLMSLIFNEIPEKSAAMGAMIMNITSNMLGLGNAATPMGLKAMDGLQKLNPRKTTATNAMCLFLVINAAPITFIPSTVISLRASCGSTNPGIIIIPAICTSIVAVTTGLVCCKIMEHISGGGK